MKIIVPNGTGIYTVELVPRLEGFTDVDELTLTLYNEGEREFSTVTLTDYYSVDGTYTLGFTITGYTVVNNDTFQIYLKENTDNTILYRGKIMATSQTPQDYKLTEGLYTYN